MIFFLEIVCLCFFGGFLGYLALLSVLALFARTQSEFSHPSKLRRFAIVIPAHDEELTIEKTLHSALAIDYPKNLFDVFVIADNCTDNTATLAKNSGAIVFERTNIAQRGKGYALRWCFDILISQMPSHSGIVVVDADSVMSNNFLRVMGHYLDNGAQAVQSSDLVEPMPGSWSSEVTRLGFTLYNYARPLGRRATGCSVGLRGNGMCFTKDLLYRVPWNAYSQAEDLEYGLQLLLNDVSVVFAPEASVLATMPQVASNAKSQRARWELGRFSVVNRYAMRLLSKAVKKMSFKVVDTLVDLVTPPFVNLLAGVVGMFGITLLLSLFRVQGAMHFVWPWVILICLGMLHVLLGLVAAHADRQLYKALFFIPRYALWKFSLYFAVLFHGHGHEWVRTKREVTIPQIQGK